MRQLTDHSTPPARRRIAARLVTALACFAAPAGLSGQAASAPAACRSAVGGHSAHWWLQHASDAMGISRLGDRVLHLDAVEGEQQDYQSDRPYPPYFTAFRSLDLWLDPRSGVEQYQGRITAFGANGLLGPRIIEDQDRALIVRDSAPTLAPEVRGAALATRALDPWAEVLDWAADTSVRVEGRCRYRDYSRVVLARNGPYGAERLFLTEAGIPVKLDRVEPHYLWGQQHAEYLYSTWILSDSVMFPLSSIRSADGVLVTSRTVGDVVRAPRDSAPAGEIGAGPMPIQLPRFLQPLPPDTIRIDANTVLLHNPGYNEVITLARDTVFLLDATQSETRAREDSTLIATIFPGRHPIVLLVTDLAWPHVAGLRFWVASGATVVSHADSRAFLQSVVSHHWTLTRDKLEREGHRTFRFVPVTDSLSLGAGAIRLYPIDGVGSEGAIMGYVTGARLLWGSDYLQTVDGPSLYGTEVVRAVERVGIQPTKAAAEHLPVTPWGRVREVTDSGVEGPR